MLKWKSAQVSAIAFAVALGLGSSAVLAEQVRYHDDHRQSAKLIFSPTVANKQSLEGEALAKAYLSQSAKRFGIDNVADMKLYRVQESLTGTHYHYQQTINGIPVLRGEAIVSISKRDGSVMRAFNNTYPTSSVVSKAAKATLTEQQALNKAWHYLQGSGQLHFKPTSQLYYVNVDGKLHLAYRTEISATKPHGAWEHVIDAVDGEILVARRTDLPRKTAANPEHVDNKWPAAAPNPEHQPLAVLEKAWAEKRAARSKAMQAAMRADGQGAVFDPDPQTTLNQVFQDGSSIPAGAYLNRTLLGITFNGTTHSLIGPFVEIANIEAPNTAPSTRADGVWDDLRENNGGSNAFNDAMTYFHLDQSQRYMQSLGFTGTKGIIERPMEVDTDGLNGADNSHYVFGGGSDYLAFGHGCVDDNEDADVILHEYGHAIQNNINPNWDGGDTGGMGEGFGDYWAGSYSYSTPNGPNFDPAKVYTWDGIEECWDGRRMDRTSYQYNSSASYGAHEFVGSVLSDELWSTPLFQALLALEDLGVPREEVDQIILESHFGLGANLKMPDMALATLAAAEALFPDGAHRDTFESKFVEVNILAPSGNVAPVASVADTSISVNTGASVTLDASTSSDRNAGDTLSFVWEQTSGAAVTLTNANSAVASFTAPASAGTLQFTVTVSDGNGGTDTETVTVTVSAPASGGDDDSGGGGGSFGWLGVLSLLLLGSKRSRR